MTTTILIILILFGAIIDNKIDSVKKDIELERRLESLEDERK